MIFVHETHDLQGGKADEFSEAFRATWRPLLEEDRSARLLWYWDVPHGTGPSYQALSLTAVRDWAAWGALVARGESDARFRDWQRLAWTLRREVTAKIMRPTAWSPLREVDLETPPGETPSAGGPGLYLHDTGWPFPGRLDDYLAALGRVLHPQERQTGMVSITGCLASAPGTARHHEVLILQRIDDWERFARLITHGETHAQRGGWMEEGLKYRDRWESKILRCAAWSPRQ